MEGKYRWESKNGRAEQKRQKKRMPSRHSVLSKKKVGIVLCITLNLKTVVPIIQVLFSFLMDVNFVQMNKL